MAARPFTRGFAQTCRRQFLVSRTGTGKRWCSTTSTNSTPAQLKPVDREKFRVALVGRPNVGKSTLFNRLVGKRVAIVNKIAGTTRDSREGEATLAGMEFTAIDTGGLEEAPSDNLRSQMMEQTEAAICGADVAVFMVDGRAGILPDDEHYARWLRKRVSIPVVLVANKTEALLTGSYKDGTWEDLLGSCYSLGMGDPVALAAEHGDGLADLFTALAPHDPLHSTRLAAAAVNKSSRGRGWAAMQKAAAAQPRLSDSGTLLLPDGREVMPWEAEFIELVGEDGTGGSLDLQPASSEPSSSSEAASSEPDPLNLAIVGRPNVGKSTLLNSLLQSKRVVVSDVPGTTRDSIAVQWDYRGTRVTLVDTAGIRRAGKRDHSSALEWVAVKGAMESLNHAHVVALVLDAHQPPTRMDFALAGRALQEGRALVIVGNKMDLMADSAAVKTALTQRFASVIAGFGDPSVITISALTGTGVRSLLPTAMRAFTKWRQRVPTAKLNRWLNLIQRINPPPMTRNKVTQIRTKYITQVKARPPTFSLFTNTEDVPVQYMRYLTNQLREEFDLQGVPIRINIRATSKNPFAPATHRGGRGSGGSGGRGGGGKQQKQQPFRRASHARRGTSKTRRRAMKARAAAARKPAAAAAGAQQGSNGE